MLVVCQFEASLNPHMSWSQRLEASEGLQTFHTDPFRRLDSVAYAFRPTQQTEIRNNGAADDGDTGWGLG